MFIKCIPIVASFPLFVVCAIYDCDGFGSTYENSFFTQIKNI